MKMNSRNLHKQTRKFQMNKKILLLQILLVLNFLTFGEIITFSAGNMKGTIGSSSDTTELSENAYILTESMEISADSIKMSGENFRYIEATGSIKGKNIESKMEFTCESLKYDRETKIAELKNNVTLTDTENDVQAKAQVIEYNQETETAVMQINIELKQKENICSGAYAVYRKNEQLLDLSGNAQIKQKSDTFRAQQITLNMDSQEIIRDGKVKGSVTDNKTSENQEEQKNNEESDENSEKLQNSESQETQNGENIQTELQEEQNSEPEELTESENNTKNSSSPENTDSLELTKNQKE